MLDARDRAQMIENLQQLLDELGAPDLTIAEANVLRPRLFDLLEALDEPPTEASVPSPRPGSNPPLLRRFALMGLSSNIAATFF
jgi:hypothetical protein